MRQDLGHGTTKRSSPPSLSVGENRSGKARLPGVHIGNGVRRPAEAPPPFRVPEAVPSEGSEHPCREPSECASARSIRNTTSRRDAGLVHSRSEERRVGKE